MWCRECCRALFDPLESLLILVGVSLYRIWTFLMFLSISMAPSIVVGHLYEFLCGKDATIEVVEPAIALVLLSYWAEVSVQIESRFLAGLIAKLKVRYSNTMGFGRFTIFFLLYLLAFSNLHVAFYRTHTIPYPEAVGHVSFREIRDFKTVTLSAEDEQNREETADAEQPTNTMFFLLSLAYLVFITSRKFYKDLMHAVRNVPAASFSVFNNCRLRLSFVGVHLLINVLYFLPCIAIAFAAGHYRTDATTAYFQLAFCACLAGMIGALAELNKPWPQVRGQLPCLYYENNLMAKNLLSRILIIPILIMFYHPLKHDRVLETEFDSTNSDVIGFNLVVSFTVLHIVKFGTHAILSFAQELGMARANLDVNFGILPEQGQDNYDDQLPPVLDAEAECPRCTSNALNNNNYCFQPELIQTSETNDSENPGETQTQSYAPPEEEEEKSEEGDNVAILAADTAAESAVETIVGSELKLDLMDMADASQSQLEKSADGNKNALNDTDQTEVIEPQLTPE